MSENSIKLKTEGFVDASKAFKKFSKALRKLDILNLVEGALNPTRLREGSFNTENLDPIFDDETNEELSKYALGIRDEEE